jgi:hypothetical protein
MKTFVPARVQIAQQVEHGFGVLAVQVPGRFVQQNRRMVHDRPRQATPRPEARTPTQQEQQVKTPSLVLSATMGYSLRVNHKTNSRFRRAGHCSPPDRNRSVSSRLIDRQVIQQPPLHRKRRGWPGGRDDVPGAVGRSPDGHVSLAVEVVVCGYRDVSE